jgi:hypothetical protein
MHRVILPLVIVMSRNQLMLHIDVDSHGAPLAFFVVDAGAT